MGNRIIFGLIYLAFLIGISVSILLYRRIWQQDDWVSILADALTIGAVAALLPTALADVGGFVMVLYPARAKNCGRKERK